MPKGSSLIDEQNNHPYITVSNMNADLEDMNNFQFVPLDIFPQIKNYIVDENDLIISVAGTLGLVKKVPKVLDKANLTENANRISEIQISEDYLYFYLNSNLIQNRILSVQTNNAQPKLALKEVRNFKIKYPSNKEQKKIANLFLRIDKKIELLEKKQKELSYFKKGILMKIFIDNESESWKEYKISDLGIFKSGYAFKNKYQGFLNYPIPFFKVSDMNLNLKYMENSQNTVNEEMCTEMKCKILHKPSIILAKLGEAIYLERKRIVEKPCVIDNNLLAFQPKENYDLEFIYYMFLNYKLSKFAQQTAVPSLSAKDIGDIRCFVPETIIEQQKISKIFLTIDKKINLTNKSLLKINNFKKALLQKMFV